ncbi:class I histocompatibility antigen, F10 alpha chain-like [Sardina pilchardus]|uniref:class I histocompatibility antigen, F10 alpha chain-like n=1 Tax=Sardina pilchardus TaxID=27697 RepID=UPI002E0D1D1A
MSNVPFSAALEVQSLEVQYTVLRDSNGQLQFQQTTLLGGDVLFHCKSPTLTDQPRHNWVTHAHTSEDLQQKHEVCKGEYGQHLHSFQIINKTAGWTEILQRRRGCQVNGSDIFVFDKWAVDGDDFLTFDPKTLRWIPQSDLAVPVAQEWNQETDWNNVRNYVYGVFLQDKCWDALNKTAKGRTHSGSDSHEGLEVYMFAKPIRGSTATYLKCHVISSDLSGVRIQLTKDGVPVVHQINLTGPLPNGDGTVQMRVQVELQRKDAENYQCHVQTETTHRCQQWDGLPCLRKNSEKTSTSHVSGPAPGLLLLGWAILAGILVAVGKYRLKCNQLRVQAERAKRIRVEAEQIRLLLRIAMPMTQWEFNRHVAADNEFYIRAPLIGSIQSEESS